MDFFRTNYILDGKNFEKSLQNFLQLFIKTENNQKLESIGITLLNDFYLDEDFISKFIKNEIISKITYLKIENCFCFDGVFFSSLSEKNNFFLNLNYFTLNNVHLTNSENFKKFFIEKNLSKLKYLGFTNTNIKDEFLISICNQNFQNLCSLNLNSSFNLTSLSIIEFFDSKMVENLTNLSLQNSEIGNEGIFALCFSKKCNKLEELDLSLCSNLNDIAFLNLLMSPNLKNLMKLNLFNTMITTNFFLDFDKRSLMKKLKYLRLEENYGLKAEGYGIIGISPSFKNLEYLHISMSKIDNVNFKKIYGSSYLTNIKTFIFYDNPFVGKFCLKEFFNSSFAETIEELDLSWMDIDNSVLMALGESASLENIKSLKIVNCNETEADGFYNFFQLKNMRNIEKIYLTLNKIDWSALSLLMKKIDEDNYKLRELDVRRCQNISSESLITLGKYFDEHNFVLFKD